MQLIVSGISTSIVNLIVCLVVFPSPEGNGIFQLDRILQTEAEKQVAGAGHLCAVFACGAGCGTVVPHADVSVYRSG